MSGKGLKYWKNVEKWRHTVILTGVWDDIFYESITVFMR
jgi:ABC-type polysaccharide transport system permease subunit